MLATPISSGTKRSTLPCELPKLAGIHTEACFREPRIGGDFFDIVCSDRYLYLMMTDIAGERTTAQHVAGEVQDAFRQQAALSNGTSSLNETEACVELLRCINGAIMSASGGVRCAPTFVAIYNLTLHLLTYINAGAPPALLQHNGEVISLESQGIPLGLFTHLTHDPLPVAMQPHAQLVLVSKGVLEARQHHTEFGIQRVRNLLTTNLDAGSNDVCRRVLRAAEEFAGERRPMHLPHFSRAGITLRDEDQDMTVLALTRT